MIEAKAHADELGSACQAKNAASIKLIRKSLAETALRTGGVLNAHWEGTHYQLVNRVAHLMFLRDSGVDAWLVMLSFVGDADMGEKITSGHLREAFRDAEQLLNLPSRHDLSPYILHVEVETPKT